MGRLCNASGDQAQHQVLQGLGHMLPGNTSGQPSSSWGERSEWVWLQVACEVASLVVVVEVSMSQGRHLYK